MTIMENAIISTKFTIPVSPNFKNPELNEATARIASVLSGVGQFAMTADIEVCKILSDVSKTQCYKDDGFASVAEYAEATFGMGKSSAHAKARAGSNFYNNPDMAEVMDALPANISGSPSKIIELLDCKPETIMKGIEKGEITAESTQKELRKWGDDHAMPESKRGAKRSRTENPTAKALPNLEIWYRFGMADKSMTTSELPDNAEEIAAHIAVVIGCPGEIEHKTLSPYEDDEGKKSIKRMIFVTADCTPVYVQWKRIAEPKKPNTHELSEADIIRMYNEMCARKQAEGRQ